MAKFDFTKKEALANLRAMVMNEEVAEGVKIVADENLVAWIDNEVDLLSRKSNHNGNSKAAKENAERMEVVKTALAEMGGHVRVSEIVTHINREDFSPNRVTAVLGKMAGTKKGEGTGEVVRTVEKGVAYFSLAE